MHPASAWSAREARLIAHRAYSQFNSGGSTYMPAGPRDYRLQSAYSMLNYQNSISQGYVDRLRYPAGQRAQQVPQNFHGYAARHPSWNPMAQYNYGVGGYGGNGYGGYGMNGMNTYHALNMGYAPGGGVGGFYGGGFGGGYGGYSSFNSMQYGPGGFATSSFNRGPMGTFASASYPGGMYNYQQFNPMGSYNPMGGYGMNGLQQNFGMNADGMRPQPMHGPTYNPPPPFQPAGRQGLYTLNSPGTQYAMNTGYQNPGYAQDYGNDFYSPRPIGQYLTAMPAYNPYVNIPSAPLYGRQSGAAMRQAAHSAYYGSHAYTWDGSGNLMHFVPRQRNYGGGVSQTTYQNNGGYQYASNNGYVYQNGGSEYGNNGYPNNGNGGGGQTYPGNNNGSNAAVNTQTPATNTEPRVNQDRAALTKLQTQVETLQKLVPGSDETAQKRILDQIRQIGSQIEDLEKRIRAAEGRTGG